MIGKLDEYLQFQQTTLNLRAQRQQLIASNIANADTPNYKARDIDFNSALKNALSKTGPAVAPVAMERTAPAHILGTALGGTRDPAAMYRSIQQGSVDGNTVDMDVERTQFADNSIRYETGLTLIGAQIKTMLAAVQG